MKYDENEKLIKETLSTITTPQYDFSEKVREQLNCKLGYRVSRKKINIGLVTAIITILSVTVLASTLPSFNKLLSMISPEMALILQPIEEKEEGVYVKDEERISEANISGRDKGIELKPLAVINDDEMIIAYLTLQDLTGNRLDEKMSISEYFVEGTTINNCQVIDYDEATKTAILQITVNGGSELNNNVLKIEIRSIMTQKKILEALPIDINLVEIRELPRVMTTKMHREDTQGGGGSGDMWDELGRNQFIQILQPNERAIRIPELDVMQISNIGFIDEKLHIQTKWNENNSDSHGYFYLVDEEGNEIEVKENNFYFGVDEENDVQFGRDYIEYILEISEEQIENIRLMGYFVEWGEVIDGEWSAEIDLNSSTKEIKIPCEIEMETWKVTEVALSPLGITLRGEGGKANVEEMKVSIKMKSGATKGFDSRKSSNQMGEIIMKFGVEIPLDVEEIEEIQINDEVIEVKF